MQPSQAKNEVRLPRSVVATSNAILEFEKRQAAKRESELSPPVAKTPPETEPPMAPTPPVDPRKDDPRYWEQRHKVTEGLLRVERDGRTSDTRAAQQRIDELQAQILTLQAGVPAVPTDVGKYFTPEQIEKFGEEQCRVMATAAEAAADRKIQEAIDVRVKPLVEARKGDQVREDQRQQEAFTDRLTELKPDWRDVDVSPGWLAWLAQTDESSGLARQDILNRHSASRDAGRIVKMFEQYETANRPPTPPMAPSGDAAGSSGNAPAAPTAAPVSYTSAQIKDYFKRAAIGKVKDEERMQFEAWMKSRAA